MWRSIIEVIREHQSFVVTTHMHPDGDGVGAAAALIELLRLQEKDVRFVCDSPLSKKFLFLDAYQTFCSFEDLERQQFSPEVLIVLDTNRKERIGRVASLLERPGLISICIDHHRPSQFAFDHMAINPEACAAGALIYTLFKSSGYPLNHQAAKGIYTSIFCDTGRFSYSSTSRKAHKIADECMKLGVQPEEIYRAVFQQVKVSEIQMIAEALSQLELLAEGQLAFVTLRKGTVDHSLNLETLDLEYFHEFMKLIGPVACIAVFRQLEDGRVRVSIRSKGELNVQSVAQSLGGGGHAQAAGVTLHRSLGEAKKCIRERLFSVLSFSVYTE